LKEDDMLKLQNTLFVLLILFALSGCSSEERLNVFNIVRDDTKETIGKLKIREEDVCWESADANEPPLCWSSTDNASATAVGPNRTVRQFAEEEITAFDRFWAKTYGILNYLGVRIKGNDADIENLNLTEHETYQRTMWITGGGVDLVYSYPRK
jgi:hypothetical protein